MYKLRVTKLIKKGELTIAPKKYPLMANHVVYLTEDEFKDVSVQIALKKNFLQLESQPQKEEEDQFEEGDNVSSIIVRGEDTDEKDEKKTKEIIWDGERKKLISKQEAGKAEIKNSNLEIKKLNIKSSSEVDKENSKEEVTKEVKVPKNTENKTAPKRGRPRIKPVGEKKELNLDLEAEDILLPNTNELEEGSKKHSVVIVQQNGEVS